MPQTRIIPAMKILSRYILKEFLGNVFLGLLIFTFVLLLDHLFELIDLLLGKGVGLGLTLKLLTLLLPSTLSLTLPMSILLASLLTYGRLSEHNEITAARASGLKAWSYVKMPLLIALLAAAFLVPFNTRWAPRAHASFRSIYVQLLKRNPLVRIEERTFVEIGEYHLYIEHREKKKGLMRGVTIYKLPTSGAGLRIFAERGKAAYEEGKGLTLLLSQGRIEKVDAAAPERWMNTEFKEYQFFIPLASAQASSERSIEEMDNRELRKEITVLKSKGLPYPILACQIQLRWALAMTPLLFAALGIPLAIRMQRGGRSIGFGMSLIIMVLYYILLMGGTALGQRGSWPPWIAVWMGNSALLASASFLYWRMTRR